MTPGMTIPDLLQRATAVIAASFGPTDVLIEKLEEYTQAFEAWSAAHKDILSGAKKPADEVEFLNLAALHARVVEVAEQKKESAGKDLREAQTRGKGIMAYIDILPKRISIAGTKKG